MPELPEVETVKRILLQKILNYKITDVRIFHSKLIKNIDFEEFKSLIINKEIINLKRIGKYLIFCIEEYVLLSHLRMEGKYYFIDKKDANKYNLKHRMIEFELDYDKLLIYLDTRKFGTMHLYSKNYYLKSKPLQKIGLEPFNNKLDLQYLKSKIGKSKKVIKTLLLDQSIISGIGNIYADEILFASSIHPLKQGINLNDADYLEIIQNSIKIFDASINVGGTTVSTFNSFNNSHKGNYQNYLKVHMRKDQKCYSCLNIIVKIKVNGRGTYFCNHCQTN